MGAHGGTCGACKCVLEKLFVVFTRNGGVWFTILGGTLTPLPTTTLTPRPPHYYTPLLLYPHTQHHTHIQAITYAHTYADASAAEPSQLTPTADATPTRSASQLDILYLTHSILIGPRCASPRALANVSTSADVTAYVALNIYHTP